MQNWEYQILNVEKNSESNALEIARVNNEDIGVLIVKNFWEGEKYKRPHLHVYLNEQGGEGWEVVSMTSEVDTTGTSGFFILLKRPI